MNQTTSHVVTLWCAVLCKIEKGIERSLPAHAPMLRCRMLLQLRMPETPQLGLSGFARVLVVRPSDVALALEALEEAGLVCPARASTDAGDEAAGRGFRLTEEGEAAAADVQQRMDAYLEALVQRVDPEDWDAFGGLLRAALMKPGSFFARNVNVLDPGARLGTAYYVTAVIMLVQTIATSAKRDASLSLTDYRFLLELCPKRRGVEKRLRAKDMVRYLRVGRSYVTTAAYRLEERGLIVRIPDEYDARGILFALTPQGVQVVQDVGDDIYAVLGGLFGQRDSIRTLRRVLEGVDAALEG